MIIFCFSCQDLLTEKDIQGIRKNYSKESIQYYYRVVYGLEGFGDVKNDKVEKFDKEIKYHLQGNVNKEKEDTVESILDSLTRLTNLKFSYTKNEAESNFLINFTDRKNFKPRNKKTKEFPKNIRGMCSNDVDKNGFIIKSRVFILNDIKQEAWPHVLLEEITQSFGLHSDSYKYLNSIFYEGESYVNELSELDKQIIKLHYSSYIKPGTSKKEFYKAFKDILQEPSRKDELNEFEKFIKQSKPSDIAIRMFCNYAFSKPNKFVKEEHIQKYRTKPIILKGIDNEVLNSVYIFLKKEFPHLIFKKLENTNIETFNLIYNKFLKSDSLNITAFKRSYNKITDYQIYKGFLLYNDSDSSVLNCKLILRNTFNAMGLNFDLNSKNYNYSNLLSNSKNSKILSKYDKEFLNIFFNPSLKSGMTKTDLFIILEKYYDIENLDKSYNAYKKIDRYLEKRKLSKEAKNILYKNIMKDSIILKYENNSVMMYSFKQLSKEKDSIFMNFTFNEFSKNMKNIQFLKAPKNTTKGFVNLELDFCYKRYRKDYWKYFFYSFDKKNLNNIEKVKAYIRCYDKELIERNKSLLNSLFFLFINIKNIENIEKKLYKNVTETSFQFTELGKELLQFYYSPVIHNGMERKKIIQILENH